MKKSLVVIAAAAVLGAAGVAVTQQAFAAGAPTYHPTRLAHVGDAKQLIVVTGQSTTSTYATLRTYQLGTDGRWTERFPAMPARNGYAGWAWGNSRIQDTGTTPAGTYAITTAFGLQANPGTKVSYRRADSNDYWVGDNKDPKTYNIFQPSASAKRTWRTSQAERLADYPTQYAYAAVIDFNRPAAGSLTWNTTYSEHITSKPVDVRRGSAIFLHVNGSGSTAGCVSLARADMINVLKWLDPAKKPRIVMAPLAHINGA
ncbi:L,D-transpeptidase [Actinoplanes sp. NPDC049265]|uniref:L,D-transpeptidase family protein n=1 Tax=Actinoplanes sp. NPDC049265 TaxID=3363902 RepID=UPI00371B54FF